MSRHDVQISFQHILVHAQEAVQLVQGRSRQDLDSDRMLNLALTRLLEIIGEASNRVPEEIQAKFPQLPWLQMRGLRNRLIHGYDSVDFDILWQIITHDLPGLIGQLTVITGSDPDKK